MLVIQASRRAHGYIQPYGKDVRPGTEYYVCGLRVLPDIELGEGSAIPLAVWRYVICTTHEN